MAYLDLTRIILLTLWFIAMCPVLEHLHCSVLVMQIHVQRQTYFQMWIWKFRLLHLYLLFWFSKNNWPIMATLRHIIFYRLPTGLNCDICIHVVFISIPLTLLLFLIIVGEYPCCSSSDSEHFQLSDSCYSWCCS